MSSSRALRVLLVLCGVVLSGCQPGADPAAPDLPSSIGAIGDSITAAVNTSAQDLGEDPDRSWVTGTADAEVRSHRERIADASGADVEAVNVAAGGARMADAPRQAEELVRAGVEHVVLLLGANDACVPEPPPAERVAEQLREALRVLEEGSPATSVYVVSVPDVTALPDAFGDDPRARAVWEQFAVCPNILGAEVSEDDLGAERERIAGYNAALAEVCGTFTNCADDGGAVFAHRFGPGEVSDADFFHPSTRGQRVLADVTWEAGPFGG